MSPYPDVKGCWDAQSGLASDEKMPPLRLEICRLHAPATAVDAPGKVDQPPPQASALGLGPRLGRLRRPRPRSRGPHPRSASPLLPLGPPSSALGDFGSGGGSEAVNEANPVIPRIRCRVAQAPAWDRPHTRGLARPRSLTAEGAGPGCGVAAQCGVMV